MSRVEHLSEDVTGRAVTIYALCEPIDKWKTGPVRYVGKTVNTVWHRVRAHSYLSKGSPRLPVRRWLKKQMEAGNPFHILHLEVVPPGADWETRERFWIAKFRSEGADLLNLTDGGEGLHGLKQSASHKAKIAAALRTGSHLSCLTCGTSFWRKLNEIRAGNAKFCSRRCYSDSLKGVSRPVSAACVEAGVAAAAQSRRARTHCKRGHEFTAENTKMTTAGGRACRACMKVHKMTYRSKPRG